MTFSYYNYTPSVAGAVPALLVWGIFTCLRLFQVVRTKALFMIPFLVGCFSMLSDNQAYYSPG
jgi:hypothetical protein